MGPAKHFAVRSVLPPLGHARSKDIMIVGHAYSAGASLITRNLGDLDLIASMVEIIPV